MNKSIIENNQNAEWKAVKKFTQDRVTALQVELEGFHSEYETAIIRGKLSFAREILKLDEKKTTVEVVSVSY